MWMLMAMFLEVSIYVSPMMFYRWPPFCFKESGQTGLSGFWCS